MTLEEYCQHKIDEGVQEAVKEAVEEAVKEAVEEAIKEAVEEAVEKAEKETEEKLRVQIEKDKSNLLHFLKKNKASDEQIISALKEIYYMDENDAKQWIRNN